MRKEYDFSKGVRGRFYRPQKVQKTIRLDREVLKFYERLSRRSGIPYQTLINLTLRKFAAEEGSLVIRP